MKKIFKYTLPIEKTFEVILPEEAEILKIGVQGEADTPVMWALVNPENPEETRHFQMLATGEGPDNSATWHNYIGTIQPLGALTFHIFEYNKI